MNTNSETMGDFRRAAYRGRRLAFTSRHGRRRIGREEIEERVERAGSGAASGDLAVGERTFHFARRNDGYERTDPALTMTQEFLAALPSDWTRQRLALDRTGIANANATAEQLAENGLVRRVKDLWSEVTPPAV